jgi:hypothetical protein
MGRRREAALHRLARTGTVEVPVTCEPGASPGVLLRGPDAVFAPLRFVV